MELPAVAPIAVNETLITEPESGFIFLPHAVPIFFGDSFFPVTSVTDLQLMLVTLLIISMKIQVALTYSITIQST